MIRDYLKSHFEKQRKLIVKLLATPELPERGKSILDLRMAIKRSRAMFRLVEALSKGEFDRKEASIQLRPLYRAFGVVRDLQIQSQLLKDLEAELAYDYSAMSEWLQDQLIKSRKKLRQEIKDFDRSCLKVIRSEMNAGMKALKNTRIVKRAENLVESHFAEVDELLGKVDADPDKLHDIRTLLKEVVFIIQMIHKGKDEQIWPEKLVYRIHQCTEEAGAWHDRALFLELLQSEKENLPFLQKKRYKELRKALKEDLEDRSGTLVYEIKSLLKASRV